MSTNTRADKLVARLLSNEASAADHLYGGRIGAIGARRVAESLRVNTTLQNLELTGNGVMAGECAILGQALCVNSTLLKLNLSDNKIDANACRMLAKGLSVNSTLQTLRLSYNLIDSEGCRLLGEGLRQNTTLRSLDLSRNFITEDFNDVACCRALRDLLATNSTIQSMYLGTCLIHDEGCGLLADALRMNSTLTQLDLSMNLFGQQGYAALCAALKTNSTLRSLDLTGPIMQYINIFADMLRTNATICSLKLRPQAVIDVEHALALGEALRDYPRRHMLELTGEDYAPLRTLGIHHALLALPEEARAWNDYEVAGYFHECHLDCAVAFAMGLHKRLGEGSIVRFLDSPVVDIVLRVYFRMAL